MQGFFIYFLFFVQKAENPIVNDLETLQPNREQKESSSWQTRLLKQGPGTPLTHCCLDTINGEESRVIYSSVYKKAPNPTHWDVLNQGVQNLWMLWGATESRPATRHWRTLWSPWLSSTSVFLCSRHLLGFDEMYRKKKYIYIYKIIIRTGFIRFKTSSKQVLKCKQEWTIFRSAIYKWNGYAFVYKRNSLLKVCCHAFLVNHAVFVCSARGRDSSPAEQSNKHTYEEGIRGQSTKSPPNVFRKRLSVQCMASNLIHSDVQSMYSTLWLVFAMWCVYERVREREKGREEV